jgi:hypothetical protein
LLRNAEQELRNAEQKYRYEEQNFRICGKDLLSEERIYRNGVQDLRNHEE